MPSPWEYAKPNSEHSHQVALFMWATMAYRYGPNIANDSHSYIVPGFAQKQFEGQGGLGFIKYSPPIPQLKWLHAIHNQGHGDAIRGAKAKAEGVKAGVYDLFLPVPTNDEYGHFYCGLYLELKVGKNKRSEAQCEFAADMMAAGYATEVAYGWLEARQKILNYLGIST